MADWNSITYESNFVAEIPGTEFFNSHGISRQLRHFRTLKLITSTCNAAWDERRTTCDTVLPSARPAYRTGYTRTVNRDTGICVHLSVKFRNKQKSQTRLE